MHAAMKTGVLLVNLGTPDGSDTASVRRYLAEFLWDERVLDMNVVSRALLLYGIILPFRSPKSAALYQKIWDPERGSPLLFHTQDLGVALQTELGEGYEVQIAMRYGRPSLASGFAALEAAGCDRLVIVPLYPQHASSSTGSTLEAVYRLTRTLPAVPALTVIPDFYDAPEFIEAVAAQARPVLEDLQPDHVLMSFHGLPEHHVRATDRGDARCLSTGDCCAAIVAENRSCYRAQCYATARAVAATLGLASDTWSVSFQSRLTKVPWVRPYTDEVIVELGQKGVKRLAVLCPSFVADCLETLEEIGMTAREEFAAASDGGDLRLVPCVNTEPVWVEGLGAMVRRLSAR